MGNPFCQHNLLNNGYLVLVRNRYLVILICVVNYEICYILIYKNLLFFTSLSKLVYLTIFKSVLQCFCYNCLVKYINIWKGELDFILFPKIVLVNVKSYNKWFLSGKPTLHFWDKSCLEYYIFPLNVHTLFAKILKLVWKVLVIFFSSFDIRVILVL